jgi:phenylpropionate dioxygenase-like ring-hydroxylating dioxygenase large terminal subunit
MSIATISHSEVRDRALRRLVGHVRASTTDEHTEIAPSAALEFRDPELAKLERDRIFGEVPIIVAHSTEVAEPLDFLSVQLSRNNVIVSRQEDGSVKAFVNACRHRGGQLVSEKSGRCRLFSCPYHRWSYDPDGALRRVTLDDTFGEFDRSKFGMVELPAEERHGFIWVVDNAARSIDVAEWLGPEMEGILAEYEMQDLVSVDPYSFEWGSNWKVMQEGFLDSYHVKYAHPTSVGKVLYTNIVAIEDFGRHFWQFVPRTSIDRFLSESDNGELPPKDYYIEASFLAPNSILMKHATHIELLSFRPCGADPERSVMEMRILARPAAEMGLSQEEWESLWKKNWGILIGVLEHEDCPILAGAQQSMGSEDAGTMLLGQNELACHLFRREARRLLDAPGPAPG